MASAKFKASQEDDPQEDDPNAPLNYREGEQATGSGEPYYTYSAKDEAATLHRTKTLSLQQQEIRELKAKLAIAQKPVTEEVVLRQPAKRRATDDEYME